MLTLLLVASATAAGGLSAATPASPVSPTSIELWLLGSVGSPYDSQRAPLGGRMHAGLTHGTHHLGLDVGGTWTRTGMGSEPPLIFHDPRFNSRLGARPAELTVWAVSVGYQYVIDLVDVRLGLGPLLTAGFATARSLEGATPLLTLVDQEALVLSVGGRAHLGVPFLGRGLAILEVEAVGHLRGVEILSVGRPVIGQTEVGVSAALGVGLQL